VKVGAHADIVKNEWISGKQVLAARLVPDPAGVRIVGDDQDNWNYLLHPISDPVTDDVIYASKEPRHFIDPLHGTVRSSFVFVTETHDDSACPFRESAFISMNQLPGGMSEALNS
jgi:hypothetical protein